LQLIFYTVLSPEEYHAVDKFFLFPRPESCPNLACRVPIPPIKHNFYSRGVDDVEFHERISIRRLYCQLLDSFLRSAWKAPFRTRRRAVAEALSASSYAGYEVSTLSVVFG